MVVKVVVDFAPIRISPPVPFLDHPNYFSSSRAKQIVITMGISKVYTEVDDLSYTQKHLMCILGILLPPVPFFLMTGPKYTVKTKEFWISVFLMIFLYIVAIVYVVWFIYIGFEEGRTGLYHRLAEDPERAEPAPESLSAHESLSAPEQQSEASPSLPSYEESEENSFPKDKKHLGDHKIQH